MQILPILIAILIFGAIIFLHELGHFITARIFKVTVREFSLGMGPQLVSYTSKKSGTVYALRMFPIGGFVSMVGEDEESDEDGAFSKKPAWQRFIIVAAGATMNLLTGLLLAVIMILNITPVSNVIAGFQEGYEISSADSGLMVGDEIIAVNGTRVSIAYETVYEIMHDGYETIDITVIRNGEKLTLPVSFPTEEAEGMLFGTPDLRFYAEERSFGGTVSHTLAYSKMAVRMVWDGLFDLLTGRVPVSSVSGPVGVTSEISGIAKDGDYLGVLYIAIVICMNVGIFNLLPIPALDGGRLVFLLWEIVTRRPVPQKYESMVHAIGIMILFGLMILVTFKDIIGLFG